jgi:hypothetical protein
MLISWNNLNILKWNNTYLHLYEIGKTQWFKKKLEEQKDSKRHWKNKIK